MLPNHNRLSGQAEPTRSHVSVWNEQEYKTRQKRYSHLSQDVSAVISHPSDSIPIRPRQRLPYSGGAKAGRVWEGCLLLRRARRPRRSRADSPRIKSGKLDDIPWIMECYLTGSQRCRYFSSSMCSYPDAVQAGVDRRETCQAQEFSVGEWGNRTSKGKIRGESGRCDPWEQTEPDERAGWPILPLKMAHSRCCLWGWQCVKNRANFRPSEAKWAIFTGVDETRLILPRPPSWLDASRVAFEAHQTLFLGVIVGVIFKSQRH